MSATELKPLTKRTGVIIPLAIYTEAMKHAPRRRGRGNFSAHVSNVLAENNIVRARRTSGYVIPSRCEVHISKGIFCNRPTCYVYPTAGGGWQSLCHECGQKHLPHVDHITDLILAGEKLEPPIEPEPQKKTNSRA